MRRRQPRDRIDYDSVSADNEPVTRTGPRGRQGAAVPVSTFPPTLSVRCRFGAGGEGEREDFFKATHFLYLSSGERRDGWTGSIKMVIRWGKLPTLQLSTTEARLSAAHGVGWREGDRSCHEILYVCVWFPVRCPNHCTNSISELLARWIASLCMCLVWVKESGALGIACPARGQTTSPEINKAV